MKFYRLFFVFFLLFSFKSFATAQVPDYLIVGKDTLRIQSNPLEGYLKDHPIPENLITSVSSANWRGYIAYFKFLNGKLVVENIYKEDYVEKENGNSSSSLVSIYKEIFGKQKNFECNFYSGLLICPSGKMLQYVHMGYSSLYENYELIEIKNGVNIKSKKFNAEEFQKFKIDYFRYFKHTEEYKSQFKEFKEMGFQTGSSNSSFLIENPGTGRENKSLKKKEEEFKLEKQIDSFMFLFLNDYIKTIEIPTK
ncbi:hypothetical protein [Flavobacterium sp. KACC 22761]|uniref:hypothetical protein n=1 Tax=Flavobacterium sp. KACC 22761 TaxID=3092665 RepID=UPI002A747A97|nr:hypothetical protein [Flavobacterium sp. KACC 22761]WPO79470.1 hypothetical protein SCB73_03605 [Flavobacterium sp. KACC 22761]